MKFFECIDGNGRRLRACIQQNNMNARPMFSLSVQIQEWDTGRWHPEFDRSYTTEQAAIRALMKRWPGMERR
jgi:hypothetical protein